MAIRNGSIADSEDIWNMQGTQFKNLAQTIYNQDLIGWNSKLNGGVPLMRDIKINTMSSPFANTVQGFMYDLEKRVYLRTGHSYSKGTRVAYHPGEITSGGNTNTCVKTFSGVNNWIYSVKLSANHASGGGTGGPYTRIKVFYKDGLNYESPEENAGTPYSRTFIIPLEHAIKEVDYIEIWLRNSGTNSGKVYEMEVFEGETFTGDSITFKYGVGSEVTDILPTWNIALEGTQGSVIKSELEEYSTHWRTWQLVKTVEVNNYIYKFTSEIKFMGGTGEVALYRIFYEGGLSRDVFFSATAGSVFQEKEYINTTPNEKVDRIEVYLKNIYAGVAPVHEKNTRVYGLTPGGNTLTVKASTDGTNWEEVQDAKIHRFTNTGNDLYLKFEINRVNTSVIDKLSEYAVWINPGAA